MILHSDASFVLYLGDSNDFCVKKSYLSNTAEYEEQDEYFLKIKDDFKLKKIIIPKQLHGKDGFVVDDSSLFSKKVSLFEREGDFIITKMSRIGIGIISADCLPVIIYDPMNHAIAAVHVGWRGSFFGIVDKVVAIMVEKYGSRPEGLTVYFGASAKSCCYKVKEDFLEKLDSFSFGQKFILKKNELFFDLPGFVKQQLLNLGVKSENIRERYNLCTMCSPNFYSYRKNNRTECRQVAIVALK